MITLNTNGNTISQGFIDNIRSDSPSTLARLVLDGEFIDCVIINITVTKGSCGSEEMTIGGVIGDCLTATVKQMGTDVKGKEIECWIGALVGTEYEYISLGKFLASDVKKTRYETTITAYSGVVAYSAGAFDYTSMTGDSIAEIINALAEQLDCTITCDQNIDTSLSVTLPVEKTIYDILSVVAMVCGGYAVNTNDGNIVIKQFNGSPTLSVNTGMMVQLPEFAETPFSINGIACYTNDSETNSTKFISNTWQLAADISGTIYDIANENSNDITVISSVGEPSLAFACDYMTADIFKSNVCSLLGYTYSPATVNLTLGDPRIEGSDVLAVTDVDGTVYTVPCHSILQTYNGGFTSQIIATQPTMIANNIGTTLPITGMIEDVEQTAREALDIADTTNQYFWMTETGQDTGAHITSIPKDEFLQDPENGGGNLLARSNGIAIREGTTEYFDVKVNKGQNETIYEVSNESIMAIDSTETLTLSLNYTVDELKTITLTTYCMDGNMGGQYAVSTVTLSPQNTSVSVSGDNEVIMGTISYAINNGKVIITTRVTSTFGNVWVGAYNYRVTYTTTTGTASRMELGCFPDRATPALLKIGSGTDEENTRNAFTVGYDGRVTTPTDGVYNITDDIIPFMDAAATVRSAHAIVNGKTCQLNITLTDIYAMSGDNIFHGLLTRFVPWYNSMGAGYSNANAGIMYVTSAGVITIKNTGSGTISTSGTMTLTTTYILR